MKRVGEEEETEEVAEVVGTVEGGASKIVQGLKRMRVLSLACTTQSFACIALLASLALRCAHLFTRLLTHSLLSWWESGLLDVSALGCSEP